MKINSPSFVTTIPLAVAPAQDKVLRIRLEAARSAYNALLGECLRRLRLMRESRAWRTARKLPKGKERNEAFNALRKQFRFREWDLYPFIQEQRRSFIGQHLDAHCMQAIAARAFGRAERWMYGTCRRPRFRRAGELRSVEGTGMKSPLHWTGAAIRWGTLLLPAVINGDDPVIRHGLQSRVRYARILPRVIRGEQRYFAQLVCEGDAYRKPQHAPGKGVVGLDIGPSTIAVVGEKSATLERFCEELDDNHGEIRRLQRKLDRQTRTNNPHCFDDRGRWIKGERATVRSRRMEQTRSLITELSRRETDYRKNLHGQLVARVMRAGNDIRTENLSYFAFQRMFGRSVRHRAPGAFMARLRIEAAKWDATVTEFSPRRALLSQTCVCGQIRKKKLSERQHECACGCKVQRDLLSAFLARFVAGGKLDVSAARKAWKGACNLLRAASGRTNGTTGGASARALPRPRRGRSPSHEYVSGNPVSAADDVAGRKVRARAAEKPGDGGQPSDGPRERVVGSRRQLYLWPEPRNGP